jgi:hypothetical protein
MNIDDVKRIASVIKDFHLMEFNRKITAKSRVHCNFAATEVISFDPLTLNFLNEDEVMWVLLHEEGHLRFHREAEKREMPRFVISVILASIIIIPVMLLFLKPSQAPGFIIAMLPVIVAIFLFVNYIERKYFYQPYWNDEFRADEYAVMGLFIIRPDLVPWSVLYSSFKHLKECKKSRKILSLNKLYLKLTAVPHPPDRIRISNARELFKKYKKSQLAHLN